MYLTRESGGTLGNRHVWKDGITMNLRDVGNGTHHLPVQALKFRFSDRNLIFFNTVNTHFIRELYSSKAGL